MLIEIGSREAISEAISRNMGCTLMPLGEAPSPPDLRQLPLDADAPILQAYLYHLEARAASRLITAFCTTSCISTGCHAAIPSKQARSYRIRGPRSLTIRATTAVSRRMRGEWHLMESASADSFFMAACQGDRIAGSWLSLLTVAMHEAGCASE
ncbi:hypothetical protein R70006_03529 [Paraburkholderia domus]|jgi:hypothetical protein|uniref:Uncharacterized protein n=1 Tax=Paraburkholderia domus TaxID=2793075 RepID=A0A9N8R4C0_9BURK|nr:hypothetical protein R75483_03073 [Paraburkholderia domus]CAE6761916.1 hypothetical protein R70006_03529 [Paraburkholderia domus]CAE6861222.1 hypothetical protein R75471_00200 [Paraburkholderia domus]CAE6871407.1 hypothetical protein R70199_01680 [Paraburkholderia domus]CAE6929731.1 hypothetical protein R70211_05018 [Paraburkholderia domus]